MLASKSRTLVGAGPQRLQAVVRVSRPARPARVRATPSRRTNVKVEAIGNLFGNLFKPPAAANPAKRRELVTELLVASSERKPDEERISNLVDELKPFGVKRPVRSTELFGEYQTVFSTSPTKAQLILNQPDVALEITETKSLGFLSATSILSGEITDLNDSTFEIAFKKQETKGGLGGTKQVNSQRRVSVVYLDSDVMVTQQEEQGSEGENVVIYSKVQTGEEKKEASQDKDAGSKKTGTGTFSFLGSGQKEGTATMAERTVKRKMAEDDAKGSSKAGTAATPTTAREQLEQLAAELREKQADVKEATKNVKEEEKRNATVLRASMAANAEIAAAAKRVEEAQAQVQDAMQGRTKALQDLKAAEMEAREAKKANLMKK